MPFTTVWKPDMRIGFAYDLKTTFGFNADSPEDAGEEYDSPDTIQLIEGSLASLGHQVLRFGGGQELLDNVCRQRHVDIVFNICEGRGKSSSREAQVPSILEMLNIPYTGSSPQCLAVCLDKPLTKRILASYGVVTPKWHVGCDKENLSEAVKEIDYFPVVVKLAHEGSSIGITNSSVAHTAEEAQALASKLISSYQQPVMFEQYIGGHEITVGVIGGKNPYILGIMEIKPKKQSGLFMYSIEVKRDYVNQVFYECPAKLASDSLERLKTASLAIFKILGCRDMARLDFRVDANGVPYFIEINPLPGLGSHSDLVIMAGLLGISHKELTDKVLSASLERYPQCAQK
ncbi:MAG: D-alanine--D-alanine ligase [Dehalococcoidales bacterium]|nr:D-alanine--D-alanine ligase [Dehalococcoidales bacterium]